MSLVAMVDVGLDAQSLEQQHAADAQQVLLLDAVLPVATVELVGDLAVIVAVLVDVGVQQIKGHTAHIGLPHVDIDVAAGVRHFMNQLISMLVEDRLDGKLVEVLGLVVGNLLSIHRQGLGKVTIAIQEPHGGHVDTAVAGLLDIVTGKDTQATRIYLEGVAQAVLHAEVGNRREVGAQRLLHVFLIELVGAVDAGHHGRILLDGFNLLVGQALEHLHGVLAGSAPRVTIQVMEQGLALGIPSPPQVAGHFVEFVELARQFGLYSDTTPLGLVAVTCLKFHIKYILVFICQLLVVLLLTKTFYFARRRGAVLAHRPSHNT